MFKLAVFSVLLAAVVAKPSGFYYSAPVAYSSPVAVAAPSSVSSHSKTDYHNENSHSVVGASAVGAVAVEPVVADVGAIPAQVTPSLRVDSAPTLSQIRHNDINCNHDPTNNIVKPLVPLSYKFVPSASVYSPSYNLHALNQNNNFRSSQKIPVHYLPAYYTSANKNNAIISSDVRSNIDKVVSSQNSESPFKILPVSLSKNYDSVESSQNYGLSPNFLIPNVAISDSKSVFAPSNTVLLQPPSSITSSYSKTNYSNEESHHVQNVANQVQVISETVPETVHQQVDTQIEEVHRDSSQKLSKIENEIKTFKSNLDSKYSNGIPADSQPTSFSTFRYYVPQVYGKDFYNNQGSQNSVKSVGEPLKVVSSYSFINHPVSSSSSSKTDYSNEVSNSIKSDVQNSPSVIVPQPAVKFVSVPSVVSKSYNKTVYSNENSHSVTTQGVVALQSAESPIVSSPVAYSSPIAASPGSSVRTHSRTDYHHEASRSHINGGLTSGNVVTAYRASPVAYSSSPVVYSASPASSVSSHVKTDYHHENSRHEIGGDSGSVVAAVRASPVAYSAPAVAYSSPVVVRKVAVAAPSYVNEVSYVPSVYSRRVYSASPVVAYSSPVGYSSPIAYSAPVAVAAGPASSSSSSVRSGSYHNEDRQQTLY